MSGELKGFTGVNDPYEIPDNPELTIDITPTFLLYSNVLFYPFVGQYILCIHNILMINHLII